MTVDELRELLSDLPGEALVLAAAEQGSGEGFLVQGAMSSARALRTDAAYDYWNDNDQDAANYAEAHGSPAFSELPHCVVLFWD